MRTITVGVFISLDGVIQAPGGPDEDRSNGFTLGGWLAPLGDEVTGAAVGTLLGGEYALLLGRKTYDIFASYWPSKAQEGHPIGVAFDAIQKYVASRDPGFVANWQNTEVLGTDPVARLREIKQGDGPRLVTQGSAEFAQALFANDLVDELVLQVYPVILGSGKRLFAPGAAPTSFALMESKTSPTGVLINRYRRAASGVATGLIAD